MIRNLGCRCRVLFLTILSVSIWLAAMASTAQAQVTNASQSAGKPVIMSMSAGIGAADFGSVAGERAHARTRGLHPADQGDPMFLPAVTYPAGDSYAVSIAAADVNGDRKPDLIVANWGSDSKGTVGVLLGNGDGTFQSLHTYYSGGEEPSSVAVADLNGDGKPDLVVANQVNEQQCCHEDLVAVLLGNGDGTFQPAVTYGSGGRGANAIAIADVNGDGKPDLLVAVWLSGQVGVLVGNGDGTFQPSVTYGADSYVWSIAVADFNHDGKADLVMAESAGGGPYLVGVMLGNGDGTFAAQQSYDSGGSDPMFAAVADVNGDGKPDVLVSNLDSSTIGVLLGNGDGTLQPAVTYPSGGTNVEAIAIADVNGDGKPDLLVANGCENPACGGPAGVLAVLLGNGDGTFQPAVDYGSGGSGANSVVAADLNGDGKPDAALSNFCPDNNCGAGVVGVLLNEYAPHKQTVTTLASSLNPSVFGHPITFTATVNSSSGTPTGTVVFYDGATQLGSGTLAGGSVSFSISTLSVGSHLIVAAYQGSSKFDRSASPRLSEVVNIAMTTTSLTSSLNPAQANQTVTFTATVAGQYGGSASGDVVFQDKGKTIATVSLTDNVAVYSKTYKGNGVHPMTAVYVGDANNAGSTSALLMEYVQTLPVASKTVLTTSGSPSRVGEPVTFTATVTSKIGNIPDGELVTFYDGTTTLGSVALAGGVASYTTSALTAGSYYIKAIYAGDSIFRTSTGHVRQIVKK